MSEPVGRRKEGTMCVLHQRLHSAGFDTLLTWDSRQSQGMHVPSIKVTWIGLSKSLTGMVSFHLPLSHTHTHSHTHSLSAPAHFDVHARCLAYLLQVPNFTKLGWVSAVGAAASLTYSTLAYALAFVAGKQPTASYAPITHDSPATAVFGAFNAIANIGW